MVNRGIRRLLEGITLCTLASVLTVGGPAPARADDSALNIPVAAFYSNDEPALQAILRFGRENNIPLGVVVGDQLCSTTITGFTVEHATAEAVFKRFVERLPSYRWDLEDHAVVFAPANISEPATKFLAVVPPPYVIQEDTLQGQAAWAWMDIRAALRPREGTALDILSSPRSDRWPALALRDLTVRQVLNRLVARKKGGAWVLVPFRDFDKAAGHRPFWVLDYAGKPSDQEARSSCAGDSGGRSAQVATRSLPPLDAVIDRFELKEATLLDAISRLSLEPITGLHIGLEEVLRTRLSDPRDRSVQFSADLSHKTIKDILETLCKLDSRYTWARDGQTINVYPQSTIGDGGYLLNVKLDAIALQAAPNPQQGLVPLARVLPDQQIGYAQIGGDSEFPDAWTASFDHLTVRQFINRLTEHLGSRSAWVWQGGRDSRLFAFFRRGFRPT